MAQLQVSNQQIIEKYMDGVGSGIIAAGRDLRLAVDRQRRWLDSPPDGYYYDEKKVEKFIQFAETLHHTTGHWSTPLIELEPVQKWMFSCMYGWLSKETGYRLITRALISKARKNAKTTEAAIVLLYHLLLDDEPGAQCFAAAQTQKQARILTDVCRTMVRKNKHLRSAFGVEEYGGTQVGHLAVAGTNSILEALSRENSGDKDGYSCSAFVVDELHAASDNRMYEALENSTAARKQSMGVIISTAGHNRYGPLYEFIEYGRKVVDGSVENNKMFFANFTLDEDDDIQDPEVWLKANPLLDVSVPSSFIADKIKEMKDRPHLEPGYRIKHLNQWVSAETSWIGIEAWDRCLDSEKTLRDFYGCNCYIGLDLASREDMTALAVLFEEEGIYYCFGKYYLPRTAVIDNEMYEQWEREKVLDVSPGARTNYDRIEADIDELARNHNVMRIVLDPANSGNLMNSLSMKGHDVSEYKQNKGYMSPALHDFRSMVNDNKFRHDGNPITRWMAQNATVEMNMTDESIMLKKRDRRLKNDGIVATSVALETMMIEGSAPKSFFIVSDDYELIR